MVSTHLADSLLGRPDSLGTAGCAANRSISAMISGHANNLACAAVATATGRNNATPSLATSSR
jgi:hypothetical protein